MEKFVPKEMTGNLFKNDKGDNPSRPDYRGEAMLNGELVEMAAWIKDGAKGKYMSISFKVKEQSAPAKAAPKRQAAMMGDDLSDVPF